MVSRVVIGALPGGGYGLKSSLPGIDVLSVGDDDTQKLSFSSNWTNIAKVHVTGIVGLADLTGGGAQSTVYFTSLGYVPFCDVRAVSSNTLYDDYNATVPPSGAAGNVGGYATGLTSNPADGSLRITTVYTGFRTAFFVIYKIGAF